MTSQQQEGRGCCDREDDCGTVCRQLPWLSWICNAFAQVNGPDNRDRYHDRRNHPNSGVSLNNNAAFTGLLAALTQQPADHWNQCNARPKYFWQPSASAVLMELHERLVVLV